MVTSWDQMSTGIASVLFFSFLWNNYLKKAICLNFDVSQSPHFSSLNTCILHTLHTRLFSHKAILLLITELIHQWYKSPWLKCKISWFLFYSLKFLGPLWYISLCFMWLENNNSHPPPQNISNSWRYN
jgi:hypothetical protein